MQIVGPCAIQLSRPQADVNDAQHAYTIIGQDEAAYALTRAISTISSLSTVSRLCVN